MTYLRFSTEEQHLGPEAQRTAIESCEKASGFERSSPWREDLGSAGEPSSPAARVFLRPMGNVQAYGAAP